MPDTKRNALAELADRFDTFIAMIPSFVEPTDEKMLDCMKRIVAELAKITYSPAGLPENPLFAMYRLDRCRAIAEEGAGDGAKPL